MGGLSIDNTRIDTTVLNEVLERRHAKLCLGMVNSEGGWTKVAISLGIYPSHLSAIRSGQRAPGPKLLRMLGLRRVVQYEEVRER